MKLLKEMKAVFNKVDLYNVLDVLRDNAYDDNVLDMKYDNIRKNFYRSVEDGASTFNCK